MTTTARLAATKVCDSGTCDIGYFLVRGDRISFVSVEQVRAVGRHKLDAVEMPSDIRLPASFVLVHDATGELLSKCDLYVLKWTKGAPFRLPRVQQSEAQAARDYFGNNARIHTGTVLLPSAKWTRTARVAFIRYRRYGYKVPLEHEYNPPVWIYSCKRPLAWRIALPEGCVIDSRGFVHP
jgi:hypothetical protein